MSACDPKSSFPLILLDDLTPEQFERVRRQERVEPLAGQRHLRVRFPSVAEHGRIAAAFGRAQAVIEAAAAGGGGAVAAAEAECLHIVLKAIDGLIELVDFGTPNAADALTAADVLELRERFLMETTLRGGDKKKSVLLSARSSASSADSADKGVDPTRSGT